MDAEEQAENIRRVNRAKFRTQMRLLINGQEDERVQLLRAWQPMQDAIDDRWRRDELDPGVPGVANL